MIMAEVLVTAGLAGLVLGLLCGGLFGLYVLGSSRRWAARVRWWVGKRL
jgi:hypothetical protein